MPEIEPPATIRKLVVGVDGSDGSTRALDWAIAEAVRSPASLELVTAWMFPMALGYVFAKTPDEVRQQVEQIATISVSGKDLRVQVDGITSDGIKTVVSYSVPYDGGTGKMDLKSSPAYDGISGRHNGTYKREIARLKNGKPVFTAISTVSSDGKTMSVFSKGISPVGRPVEAHVVYDKLN